MTDYPKLPSELVGIIHDVRKRWRMKLALRGAAIAAGCVAVALVGSAVTLQWMRFTPESILLFRIVMATVVAVLAYFCVVRPLLRSVSDEQVALYLEEHEPSLEAAIISAVESERIGEQTQSAALVRKLVQNAVAKVHALEDGRRVERSPVRRYSGALGGVFAIAAAIFLLGPAYMRHALSALLVISRSVEAAAPYSIEVTPGPYDDSARRRSTRHGEAAWLPGGPGRPDDPQEPDGRLRARAAHPRRGQVRSDAVRRRGADRLLRRSARRALADLLAQGRRHAVRPEARAGVPLPGVHGPPAAQD
jgi:hypothetical protein